MRLKKDPLVWIEKHAIIAKLINTRVKTLPCPNIVNPKAFNVVEIDALKIGYHGILKQNDSDEERLARFTSRTWN